MWSPVFLRYLIIQFTQVRESRLTEEQRNVLQSLGTQDVQILQHGKGEALIPQGPYFLDHGRLHEVYRLYPDTSGAFVVATVPCEGDG